MTNFDPLLDTDLLHTELLKTIDSKADVINLKVEQFSATTERVERALQKLSIIEHKLDEFLNIRPALELLIERSTPRSACIFCSIDENVDSHTSGRCPRFPNPYSRTFQVSKMGLCGQCLRPAHERECRVMCGICHQAHNALLCPARAPSAPYASKKRKL